MELKSLICHRIRGPIRYTCFPCTPFLWRIQTFVWSPRLTLHHHFAGGFSLTRGGGSSSCGHGSVLKTQLSFTRQDSLSQVSEVNENVVKSVGAENGHHNANQSSYTNFGLDPWENSNSIVFSSPPGKHAKMIDGDMYSFNTLETQVPWCLLVSSLPEKGPLQMTLHELNFWLVLSSVSFIFFPVKNTPSNTKRLLEMQANLEIFNEANL